MDLTPTPSNAPMVPFNKMHELINVAFERTNKIGTALPPANIVKNICADLITEFPTATVDDFTKALRNGGLGRYGVTYTLSTQVMCVWMREYLKAKSVPTKTMQPKDFYFFDEWVEYCEATNRQCLATEAYYFSNGLNK